MSANIDTFQPQKQSTLRREPLSELSHVHQRVTELEKEVTNLKAQISLILKLEEHYVEDYDPTWNNTFKGQQVRYIPKEEEEWLKGPTTCP